MTLQLAEGESPYIVVPSATGGRQLVHVAAFANLTDDQFEKMLDAVEPFQMSEDDDMLSQTREKGWRRAARQERSATRQKMREARLARKEARTSVVQSRAGLNVAKSEGIRSGTFEPGAALKQGIQGATGVLGSVLPALIPGGGAAGSERFGIEGGIDFGAGDVPSADDKTFLEKYGLWIGLGAAALVGIYVFTRKK